MPPQAAVNRSWFMTSETDGFDSHIILCEGPIAQYCKALLAVDVQPNPPVELTVIPSSTTAGMMSQPIPSSAHFFCSRAGEPEFL